MLGQDRFVLICFLWLNSCTPCATFLHCRSSPKRRDLRKLLKPSRKNQPPLWREPGADKSGLACPQSKCKSGQESLEILTAHGSCIFRGGFRVTFTHPPLDHRNFPVLDPVSLPDHPSEAGAAKPASCQSHCRG